MWNKAIGGLGLTTWDVLHRNPRNTNSEHAKYQELQDNKVNWQ